MDATNGDKCEKRRNVKYLGRTGKDIKKENNLR
jgi:hypothetical protein